MGCKVDLFVFTWAKTSVITFGYKTNFELELKQIYHPTEKGEKAAPPRGGEGRHQHAKGEEKTPPPKGGEGRQHHAKKGREGKGKRNTTQRKRPSNSTQQKRGEAQPHAKEEGKKSSTLRKREVRKQHLPKKECAKQHHPDKLR